MTPSSTRSIARCLTCNDVIEASKVGASVVCSCRGTKLFRTRIGRVLVCKPGRCIDISASPDPDLPDSKRASRFAAKGGTLVAMLIAEQKRDDRRELRDRHKLVLAEMPAGPDGEDHGMDLGPAALARSRKLERVDGRLRGAGQRKAVPVYAVVLDASSLFERLQASAQISDRQARAGSKLILLRRMGAMDRRVTARYPVVSADPVNQDDVEELEALVPERFDAATYHRWLMRQLPAHTAALIDAACMWTPEDRRGHPGTRFLATMQVGLTRIADLLNLPAE